MVGIIILNYNNNVDIFNCIETLFKYTDSNTFKIVVVDNGSIESIRTEVGDRLLKEFDSNMKQILSPAQLNDVDLGLITYLTLPKNIGYARGNNAGIELAMLDKSIREIMILNSDVIFIEDVIGPLSNQLYSVNNVGSISPLLLKLDGSIEYWCARSALKMKNLLFTFSFLFNNKFMKSQEERLILKQDPELFNHKLVEMDVPSGSCMMFKANVLKEIGGFDPNTFLYYEEDILSKRLKNKNLVSLLVPNVKCIHVGGATTTKAKTAYFLKKCNYKSLLYYINTYEQPARLGVLYLKLTAHLRLVRLRVGLLYRDVKDIILNSTSIQR